MLIFSETTFLCPVASEEIPRNGGLTMTDIQKQRIKELRESGLGYKKIAQTLKIPLGTVQTFCRREKLTAVSAPVIHDADHCPQCGITLVQTAKVKRRKFCSDDCRIKWWTEHPCSKKGNTKSSHTVVCDNCGQPFTAYGKAPRKYCSHNCYIQARFGGDSR